MNWAGSRGSGGRLGCRSPEMVTGAESGELTLGQPWEWWRSSHWPPKPAFSLTGQTQPLVSVSSQSEGGR